MTSMYHMHLQGLPGASLKLASEVAHLQERMLEQVRSRWPFQRVLDGALRHKVLEVHAEVIALEQRLLGLWDDKQHPHRM